MVKRRQMMTSTFAAITTDIRVFPAFVALLFILGEVSAQGEPPDSISVVKPDSAGTLAAEYAIQVGAFARQENAVKLATRLHDVGFPAVIFENLLDGENTLFLVWVGRYNKPEAAATDLRKIEELTGVRGVLRERMLWRRR
jgi:cell division septation protein DedD